MKRLELGLGLGSDKINEEKLNTKILIDNSNFNPNPNLKQKKSIASATKLKIEEGFRLRLESCQVFMIYLL
jgi:hypothetical protein